MAKTSTLNVINFSINNEDLFHFAEEQFSEEPGQNVIDALLRYSRSFEVRPSALVGQIESVNN